MKYFPSSISSCCLDFWLHVFALRKHAYSNILKILPPKKWKFSDKNPDIFQISAQNIDCWYSLEPPRWGGSNEYPQSMFLSRNNKNVYPCKPQFYYIKVGFKGSKLYRHVFMMEYIKTHLFFHRTCTSPFWYICRIGEPDREHVLV